MLRIRAFEDRRFRSVMIGVIPTLLLLYFTCAFLSSSGNTMALKCKSYASTQSFDKVLHQIWTTEDIPAKWVELQKGCQAMNSDYEYKMWTHKGIDDFMEKNYPWFMDTYRSYPYQIQRLDAGRYFILYHYGGVYIDMDMKCLESFSNIIKNVTKATPNAGMVLGATEPFGVTNNFIIGKKHHPFMEYVTSRLPNFNHWFITPYFTVMLSVGAMYMGRSSKTFPCQEQLHTIPARTIAEHYLDHKHLSAWHRWDGPIMLWFDRNGRALLYVMAFATVLLTLWTLRKRWTKSTIYNNSSKHNGIDSKPLLKS